MSFFGSSSRPKRSSSHKTHKDKMIEELQQQLAQQIEETDRISEEYRKLEVHDRYFVEESKALQQQAKKYKKDLKEMKDVNEELLERVERRGNEIKQQAKLIERKDNEVRQKDKDIKDLQAEKKSLSVITKDLRNEDVTLREKVAALANDKRRLNQDILALKGNEEKLLAEKKKLRDDNAQLVDWVKRERKRALDREARERREAESRAQGRRPLDDYLDESHFSRPMPSRSRRTGTGYDSDY